VNLNTSAHALTGPINPQNTPPGRFRGTFPGAMALGPDGRFLYVVDQGGFQTHTIDTTKIDVVNHGIGAADPNNFATVAGAVKVRSYTFCIKLQENVSLGEHVGIFQYKHLDGSINRQFNHDYPSGYPGTSYPDDMQADKTIRSRK
jgi:hypothetical protein